MAERASINQKIQIGVETTAGTSVPANKSLQCFSFTPSVEAEVSFYRATGHKYSSIQELNKESSTSGMEGNMDFNGLVYPLSGIMGTATVGAAASSTTAKQWAFVPPITGNASPKTFTIEQGDLVRAHKFSYGLLTKFSYKGTRSDFSCSGDFIGQLITDGVTMTASPTAIALAPISANMFSVYLDDDSADFGTTKLTRFLSIEYSMENVYGPAWFINRADPSFSTHVDMEPKTTVKILLEADSQGMGLLTSMRSGDTRYLRVEAIGKQIASDGGGGTDPIYNSFIHDMAIKMGKPSAWSDQDGIFAIEYEAEIVEDATWDSGKAQELTLINLLSAL
jgi:hypothetical protein